MPDLAYPEFSSWIQSSAEAESTPVITSSCRSSEMHKSPSKVDFPGPKLEWGQDLIKPHGCSERQIHKLLMASALCRRGCCGQCQESGNTKLWGEAPTQMDPSSKGAFRGEAAQRNGRGIMRGGTGEQLLCKVTCVCWESGKGGFQIPEGTAQKQGSFWLVLWPIPRTLVGVPFDRWQLQRRSVQKHKWLNVLSSMGFQDVFS